MNTLPWLLLIIGIAIVVAVYAYTRYQQRAREDDAMSTVDHGDRSISADDISKSDVLDSSIHSLIDDDKEVKQEEVILILNIRARDDQEWRGEKIIQCALRAGLECGTKGIFEYYGDKKAEGHSGQPIFYVADFVNPGTFDWENMSQFKTKGMSLFMRLPVSCPAAEGFEKMLTCCRDLVAKLDADILDRNQAPLTEQCLQDMHKTCEEYDARQER